MTEKIRAAAYVRVSTARQAREGLSLDEQQRAVEAYIAGQEGWEHAGTFVEAGMSGRRDDRPELAKLLATADRIDALVIPKLDRLGRSTLHLLRVCDDMKVAGVRLVSLGDSIDTSTAAGQMLLEILASVAAFESARIGERVASVSAARCAQGKAHGRAPYGYRSAGKDGLVVVPEEAAVVRRVFREYAEDGRSQREICRGLASDGISAQRGQWTQGMVSKVLRSPVYVGQVHVNGQTYPGLHDPIIAADLWRKAEQLREAGTRTRRGRKPTANHLLAGGMLRCGRCGGAMYASTRPQRGSGISWEAYTCSTRHRVGLDACDQGPVYRQPIDEAVWKFVTETALDLDATRREIVEQTDARLAELATVARQAQREAATAQDRLNRIRGYFQDGRIDPDDWREQRDQLTAELDASKANAERLEQQRHDLEAGRDQVDAESAVLDELTAIKATIMGEARDGSSGGVEAFRTALRRLFVGFDLAPFGRFDVPGGEGIIWPQDEERAAGLHVDGYALWPRVRPEALEWDPQKPWALKRLALALRGSDPITFAT